MGETLSAREACAEVGVIRQDPDIAAFLLARIAEHEVLARRAAEELASAKWWAEDGTTVAVPFHDSCHSATRGAFTVARTVQGTDRSVVDHIVTWDPKSVLAECEAKRRIVRDLAAHADRVRDGDLTVIISPEDRALAEQARWLLRLLALPYADHPDYRPEWRPDE